jgi:hypothetical protein
MLKLKFMQKNIFIKPLKYKAYVLMSVVIMACMSFILVTEKAEAAPDSSLIFSPASKSVMKGADFTLEAVVDPGSHKLSVTDISVTYDPAILRLDKITPSDSFALDLQSPAIDNKNGKATISRGITFGSNLTSKTTVATFYFHALAAAENSKVSFADASLVAGDDEPGVNELKTRSAASITVKSDGVAIKSDSKKLNLGFAKKLFGRILIQVQNKGKAWYINPGNLKRYYLGRPSDAFQVMRKLGLGVKHEIIKKYKTYPLSLQGKILIDVEDKGKAYYINPADGKAYFLGKPADAFNLMRKLGMGITDTDLDKIEASQ